jgi:hypothetical protein
MKFLAILILSTTYSFSALATQYECLSNGTQAQLTIENSKTIVWSEPNSASSAGRFQFIEKAPYSEFRGHRIYSLTDFFKTEDSEFRLALKSNGNNNVKVAIYYYNDDHEEDVHHYNCKIIL